MKQAQLISHGWHKNTKLGGAMIWRDPFNLLSHYTFRSACIIQKRRNAKQKVPKPGTGQWIEATK